MNNKYKISNLISELTKDLHEREEAIKLAILALLSNESIFLLGPPGVAKSLVSRKIKEGIKDASNFEYLMNKFSTPDEIFGAGMLNQRVIEEAGITGINSGLAAGIGVERIAMLKYGITDIRDFYNNDFDILKQFNK